MNLRWRAFIANRTKQGSLETYFNSKAKQARLQLNEEPAFDKETETPVEATVEAKKLSTKKGTPAVMEIFNKPNDN